MMSINAAVRWSCAPPSIAGMLGSKYETSPAAVKVACASASSAITSVCGTTAFGKPLSTKSAYPRLANVRMSSPSGVAAARSASSRPGSQPSYASASAAGAGV